MIVPDVDRADTAYWAYAVLPAGDGLSPLPSSLWESWEVRRAVAIDSPGTVIAIARQAHGLHQRRLGLMAGFSQSAISRLESGGNLAFDLRVLRIFQRLLGIPPHLLGLSDETFPLLPEDADRLFTQMAPGEVTVRGRSPDGRIMPVAVDRYTLLTACTSSIVGALSVDSPAAVEGNRSIDPDVVRRLRVARRLLNESDNWLGAPNLLAPVREMWELADRMRRAATGELRRSLLDVAALYAEFYGWLHQEVGDLRGAVEWTERALQQALAAEDRELVAYVYIRMGQLAEGEGDSDRVIGLARAALRENDLSAEVRAMALQQEARGYAVAGDVNACLTKFDETATSMRDIDSYWTDEYRLGYWYSERILGAQHAACLLELGRWREAITLYEENRASLAKLCQWEQGLHMAKLARAYASSGEPEHAATLALDALTLGRNTGSVFVMDELRRLDRWDNVPAIARIRGALGPAPDPAAT
jgi:transcriptional regulator with XRE-family HTH domain/tetratricopeptide (TPR) repeat protein